MKSSKWLVFGLALGMMAATAGWLRAFQKTPRLGPAGVKVGAVPIYDEHKQLAAKQSVLLPAAVPGLQSMPGPVSTEELNDLPKDTTFGRRFYWTTNGDFAVQLTVVLMGTDHTSIHQPQYCLYAAHWAITNTERVSLPMDRPFADVPAIKISATQNLDGKTRNCIYVYWFVSGENITSEEGSRLWSMWKTILQKGVMERWAYVSYFAPCVPGTEEATFERLEKFIRASAPQFQLVTGQPPGRLSSMAARQ